MKLIVLTKGTKNVINVTNLFIISGFIFYRLPTNITVKIVGVIKPNGTAIGVVCVTWRSYPANSPICWQACLPTGRELSR